MERMNLNNRSLSGYWPLFNTESSELQEIKTELVRKSLHFLIALTPSMAAVNRPFTAAVLMVGTLFYAVMETLRLSGVEVPLVSSLTSMASRPRDRERFVLGPVTLGLGALLALLLYPSPAASIAIYAMAFGDGFASLIGKVFGRHRPGFMLGKSLEGSMACFGAVFVTAYGVSRSFKAAFIAALTATVAEALPLEDYDNIILPMSVGFMVQLVVL
ncbi:phosphatidate cytidylyltransferase [Spirochaetia bacterium]|nr:phosphatidate cytidylyltransferase [Spirochaetia bacterium]